MNPPNCLPTEFLTAENPAQSADDFVGDAREAARKLERIVAASTAANYAPIKLLLSGPSGVGKTAACYYLRKLLGVNRWAVREANGTDVGVDMVRELSDSLHLSYNDAFGPYRVIEWHEADRMTDAAQVAALTLIDNLPRHTVIACTTNKRIEQFEVRFQRRFKFVELHPVETGEIKALLMRWPVPEAIANQIAVTACGSPATALIELEEYLMDQPMEAK